MSGRPNPATVFGRGQVEPDVSVPPVEPDVSVPPVDPTPATAQCAPGVVCRIYVGGSLSYSTKRMTLDEAIQVADVVDAAKREGAALFTFPSAHHERVRVDPTEIRSCEVVRVDGLNRHLTPGQLNLGGPRRERAS